MGVIKKRLHSNDQDLHCTLAGATGTATVDGHPLLASTSDDPFTTRSRLVVVAPSQGYKFIATQIESLPGSEALEFNYMHGRGVNERGFAYTWSGALPNPEHEPDYSQAHGLSFQQFGHLLLNSAQSLDEAIELLETNPRAIHGNFLFADAQGEVALVEVSTLSMNVETRIRDGWLGRTNHWISPQMVKIGRYSGDKDSSMVRLERITDLLEEGSGRIDVEFLARCFQDHATLEKTGWSICAHGHKGSPGEICNGTVSAEIIQPTERTLHYCYGWPCGGQVDYPDEQVYQDRSWGYYLPFRLDDLEPGEYGTMDGRLTPLGIQYLAPGLARVPNKLS